MLKHLYAEEESTPVGSLKDFTRKFDLQRHVKIHAQTINVTFVRKSSPKRQETGSRKFLSQKVISERSATK